MVTIKRKGKVIYRGRWTTAAAASAKYGDVLDFGKKNQRVVSHSDKDTIPLAEYKRRRAAALKGRRNSGFGGLGW